MKCVTFLAEQNRVQTLGRHQIREKTPISIFILAVHNITTQIPSRSKFFSLTILSIVLKTTSACHLDAPREPKLIGLSFEQHVSDARNVILTWHYSKSVFFCFFDLQFVKLNHSLMRPLLVKIFQISVFLNPNLWHWRHRWLVQGLCARRPPSWPCE